MKKGAIFAIAVSLLIIPGIGICESNGWTGNLNGYWGIKNLDSDDWDPVDEHSQYGILLDFRPKNWPVNIAIDYLKSDDDVTISIFGPTIKVEGETREIDIGIRKIFENSSTIRPYVGGGLAFINGEFGFAGLISEDDDAIGIWIDVGLYWTLAEHFNIGFDLRYSKAEITLFGVDGEAGGLHAGLIFGYHW
jgi:hypothetical protein